MQLFMTVMAVFLIILLCVFFAGIIIQLLGILLSTPIWVYILIALGFILFRR